MTLPGFPCESQLGDQAELSLLALLRQVQVLDPVVDQQLVVQVLAADLVVEDRQVAAALAVRVLVAGQAELEQGRVVFVRVRARVQDRALASVQVEIAPVPASVQALVATLLALLQVHFLQVQVPAVDPFALCSARRQCKQVHIFNISHFVTTFQVYVI